GNVRARIERIVLAFLDDDFDDITIVAYSAGAAVAYDVLCEGRPVPLKLRHLANEGAQPPPIRLITAGSGLYHMWSFANAETERGRRRLADAHIDGALSGVDAEPRPFPFWTDLFARFDFVAAGPLRPEIADHSRLRPGV